MAEVFSFPADRYVLIGKIGKPQGLRGELRVFPLSGRPDDLRSCRRVVLVSPQGRMTPALPVVSCRTQGNAAIVGLEEITDREAAAELKGMGVLLDRKDLAADTDGMARYRLPGLQVRTDEGRVLGRVEHIFSNGAQDVLVVGDGREEYLIPLSEAIVVRRTDKEIVIAPPPGLLEINADRPDGHE